MLMETFPIAGQLLEQKFLLGIPIRDLVDVFSIPLVLIGLASSTGISDGYYLWMGGLGFAVSALVLVKTPATQRPRHWVPAYVAYHIGTTTYLNRPVERDRDRGRDQDVVLTYPRDNDSPVRGGL